MSNAAKHRKKAAEFEQLKQIDRAIAAYIKAIEESESAGEEVDVALFNKVGDLTLRQGRVADAVTYYERAVEHYATAGLFNNAIALCNKILRSAPGRANVYFTLGRICAKKGLRGDATRNFLEYATRMQQEGRVDEGMRALAEVADLTPELTEVRRLVEEHAERAGIALPRRRTPAVGNVAQPDVANRREGDKTSELIFLDVGLTSATRRNTPPLSPRVPTPVSVKRQPAPTPSSKAPIAKGPAAKAPVSKTPISKTLSPSVGSVSLDEFMLFDPSRPELDVPTRAEVPAPLAPAEPALPQVSLEMPVQDEVELEVVVDLTAVDLTPSTPVDFAPIPSIATEESAAQRDTVSLSSDVQPLDEIEGVVPQVTLEVSAPEAFEVVADLETTEFASAPDLPTLESPVEPPAADVISHVETSQLADLLVMNDFGDQGQAPLDGLTSEESVEPDSVPAAAQDPALTWIIPEDVVDAVDEAPGLESTLEVEIEEGELVAALPDLVVEDFDHVADDPSTLDIVGNRAGTPTYSSVVARSLTPLEVSPIPELEAAIEAGALAAALAESDPEISSKRPPFRIDPHDFILPGELPPLMVEDSDIVAIAGWTPSEEASYESLIASVPEADAQSESETEDGPLVTPSYVQAIQDDAVASETPVVEAIEAHVCVETEVDSIVVDSAVIDTEVIDTEVIDTEAIDSEAIDTAAITTDAVETDAVETDAVETDTIDAAVVDVDAEERAAEEALRANIESMLAASEAALAAESARAAAVDADTPSIAYTPSDVEVFPTPRVTQGTKRGSRAVSTTPALPIAAVAAEANVVATSRRDELRAAVAAAPHDWVLRRRLAEALFEAGEREQGLSELQAALVGFSQAGHWGAAADIADELIRISPERIQYHQKRVELAVRLNDQQRLRIAYLDLGDTLSAVGDETRSHAVYARVLEIDPWDERARAALGAAAPPPPPKPTPDEEYVDLTDWLREEGTESTRMRMREPVVSGDEQADFDSLLRHFKEGVSRSLGEEDYESHYDLGVAYKEMGLTDDAIAEFQRALRSRRHRLPAYEALGQCFVEQSRYSVAATVLTRALHEPGMGDGNRVGVLYLLAYSCEALQRWDEARSYYSRVYATDINFRDVAARLAALDQIAR